MFFRNGYFYFIEKQILKDGAFLATKGLSKFKFAVFVCKITSNILGFVFFST